MRIASAIGMALTFYYGRSQALSRRPEEDGCKYQLLQPVRASQSPAEAIGVFTVERLASARP